MAYKNDNILGKRIIILGTDTRQVSSLEQVLLYAGADVIVFNDVEKGTQQIPSCQAHIIIFDDSGIKDPLEVVKSIKDNSPNQSVSWLIIHTAFSPDSYHKELAGTNTHYISKTGYDASEVLKGLSAIMKQSPPVDYELKIDIPSEPLETVPAPEAKVLIFEDDPLLQNILSIHLSRAKIHFKISESAQNFKPLVEAFDPTVVLLDLTLEGLNGLEVLENIRQDTGAADLPVIIFTNSADEEVREKTAKLGVTDFLIKANTNFNELMTLLTERSKQKNVNNLSK